MALASAPPAPPDDELGRAVARFVEFLASERRASPHTVSAYRRDLESLLAFIRARQPQGARFTSLDKFTLRAWLGEIAKRVAPPTIARKISSVRALCDFLARSGELRTNPSATLASPKLRRKLPRFLAPDAAAQVSAPKGGRLLTCETRCALSCCTAPAYA
jgi:integrase/recombinase XerC